MNNERILIIDDSETIRFHMKKIFSPLYKLYLTTNGNEGIAAAKKYKPDLIILDVVMPEENGFNIIKKIKSIHEIQDIPVIFISSLSTDKDEFTGLDLGAVDYIFKPINPKIAIARVKNHLLIKKQQDILKEIIIRDQLTGIYNRRYFFETVDREWKRCIRLNTLFSLLMIDIDYFKQYNDNYGHQKGDECLKRVAENISDSLKRPGDFAARYGGEEFICVLPNTDQNGAMVLAKNILENIQNLKIAHQFSDVSKFITISIGVGSGDPNSIETYRKVLQTADLNLYEAKKRGRNQIIG